MNEFLHQPAHHTLYQALQWVQSTPPLFNPTASPFCLNQALPVGTELLLPETTQLDTLARLLNKKGNPLLGIFYETLWQFLLNQLPDSQILANNLQVQSVVNGQKQTVGEFDLIYRHNQQVIHRELAIKFYLGIPGLEGHKTGSRWQQWVGPGLRDRLDRKMQRLIHHQIALSETEAGRQALAEISVESEVQKEVLVQGRLFYPLYHPDSPARPIINPDSLFQDAFSPQNQKAIESVCPSPAFSNPKHLRGFWLTLSQFQRWPEDVSEDYTYQLPDKWQWLNQQSDAACLEHKTIVRHLNTASQPGYVMVLNRNLNESIPLFIVPDKWPEKAESVCF